MNLKIWLKKTISILFLGLLCFVLTQGSFFVKTLQAQTQQEKQAELKELEQKMKELQEEIQKHEGNIAQKQQEKRSLQRDISLLKSDIARTKALIEQTQLSIQRIQWQIESKQKQIKQLEEKIAKNKEILAEHLRTLHYYDRVSLLELMLGQDSLSDVFASLESLEVLQGQILLSLDTIRNDKKQLSQEREELEEKEEEQVANKKYHELQKQSLQQKEEQKQYVLRKTKGEEARYQDMLQETKIELKEVVTRINLLQSGGQSLTPQEALRLANYASALTGVRPAFLLAILQQESNLNKNVGSCHYDYALRGSHAATKSIFIEICERLGLDPDQRTVSCPVMVNGQPRGSGGAMGAAQFMPRTWKTLEADLVRLLDNEIPNPWNVQHALVAMGLYLKRNGADAKTYQAERRAAGAYFGRCSFAGIDYCDDVIRKANIWEEWINDQ